MKRSNSVEQPWPTRGIVCAAAAEWGEQGSFLKTIETLIEEPDHMLSLANIPPS